MRLTRSVLVAAAIMLTIAARPIPLLTGPVVDEAGVLSSDEKNSIATALEDFQRRTGNQIQVVIVKSLEGDPIDDFSIRLAESYGIGRKGKDNGVILLVSMDDRQLRIEVGGGLEADIPDALAGRIIDRVIVPEFKQNRYSAGLAKGLQNIATALGSKLEYSGIDIAEKRQDSGTGRPLLFLLLMLFILAFNFFPLFLGGGRYGRSGGRYWGSGGLSGGGGFGGGIGGGWSGGGGGFSGGGASGRW